MMSKHSIPHVLLFIFVAWLGIEIGAGLYETFVVMPTWTNSPPDSVLAFHTQNTAHPELALNAGPRFWMVATPLVGVLALAALISGFRTQAPHRTWRIVGTILALIVVISTFAWFVPNIMRLHGDAVTTMTPDEVASLTNRWVNLNKVRIIVYVTGWLCALRALSIPNSQNATPQQPPAK